MRFVDDVISVGPDRVETTMTLREDHIMSGVATGPGEVSPLIAIELFAQSAAVLMSHRTSGTDPNPVAGALLGTRGITTEVDRLKVGDVLIVRATEKWGQGALAQFECELFRVSGESEERCASGSINVVGEALPPRR